ncbi:MAG: hydantoinase/oxoprolinase family protein, partial [Pseudomonadota bacterium]
MRPDHNGWQFWIDRGGTFTDVIGRAPDGALTTRKILSVNPNAYPDAAIEGVRQILGVKSPADLSSQPISAVKMGTTVATNALLEREGTPTVLVMTEGLEDHLEIGYQARPDIFAKQIIKPGLLYERVIGAQERVLADGSILKPLAEDDLRRNLEAASKDGYTACAIVLMHAYAFPDHERRAAQIATEAGFSQVSMSHDVSPLIRMVGRGDTTVADAYLSPILRTYVSGVATALNASPTQRTTDQAQPHGPRLQFMTSAGGLKAADSFEGRDAVLSGPAGGIVAMSETAGQAGFNRVIGFDMGGTSTDVSHYAGDMERTLETVVAGVRMRVPMLDIHTVAAGGGSILNFDGQRFTVGPQSAGSHPGPKSYRNGGPLTVTDANLMVGKLDPDSFPAVFGPGGDQPLDHAAVVTAFQAIADELGDGRSAEQVADGFVNIAIENMASAVKKISIERGHDVTQYALNCFGAAGGQHACLLADRLEMNTVLVHPLSGLLSAYGMGLAPLRAGREVTVEKPFNTTVLADTISNIKDKLTAELQTELINQGADASTITSAAFLWLKTTGTDAALKIPYNTGRPPEPTSDLNAPAPTDPFTASHPYLTNEFLSAHMRQFGFEADPDNIVIDRFEIELTDRSEKPLTKASAAPVRKPAPAGKEKRIFTHGAWHTVKTYTRETLHPGTSLDGPAIIIEPHQTVVVEPGWQLQIDANDQIILQRSQPRNTTVYSDHDDDALKPDPVLLEVFNNLFMSVAEQMGETLRLTSRSVNIKERLDFSCALFEADGALVANAPHVPVHLGSMDRSVSAIIDGRAPSSIRPGDVFALNAPYNGGTHLPDITVISPIFDDSGRTLLFWVASRGHHEDIGGLTPGSMTPHATTLEEEGVVIDNLQIVRAGTFLEAEVRAVLAGAKYPARQPDKNIADLKAQIAANARGAEALRKIMAQFGKETVSAYMR